MQMKMKLAVISAAVILAACGKKEEAPAPAPAAAPAAPAAPANLVVKIGHVGPTSGAIAHLVGSRRVRHPATAAAEPARRTGDQPAELASDRGEAAVWPDADRDLQHQRHQRKVLQPAPMA